MHAVDAEIARPRPSDDRVEIGPIAIEEGAGAMHRSGDLVDFVLE